MKITQLDLQDYRNYSALSLQFSDAINIFLGENAQGKTNLLESIYVLGLTKSFRTAKDKELTLFNKDEARISGIVQGKNSENTLEVFFSKNGKRVKFNHLRQNRLSDYYGILKVILFSPEDLEIIKGSPGVRRRFVDMELSLMNPLYLHTLSEYQRILKQKNKYLKKISIEKKTLDSIYLDVLDEQLAML
ncbi:MAG: DNA replication and repair protein RecF, partial [Streptococcaceae bacterium]|nr:DNA replication and repair protein RecF [Streptococcaceae bacterium]